MHITWKYVITINVKIYASITILQRFVQDAPYVKLILFKPLKYDLRNGLMLHQIKLINYMALEKLYNL